MGVALNRLAYGMSGHFESFDLSIKGATSELEDTLGSLTAIIDSMADGLLVTSPDGTINLYNPRLLAMFNLQPSDMNGHTCTDVFGKVFVEFMEESLSCSHILSSTEIHLANGHIGKAVATSITKPLPPGATLVKNTEQSECLGKVILVRDITNRMKMEVELIAAREAAEKANIDLEVANRNLKKLDQLKSELLSSVSHELRTPLTSIRGFTQLIQREFERTFAAGESDPKRKRKGERILDNLEIIRSESERLTRLINDVLDLAKIESGRNQWHDTRFPLHEAIQQAVNAARGQFTNKPAVTLQVSLPTPELTVTVDRDRLIQVLINLLNNAAKFTDQGEVRIACVLDKKDWVQIDVIDTGRGFANEDAEIIFNKFQQARQNDILKEKPTGTGLGLSICREIIVHYGGKIWATSELGVGSCFSLTLPVTQGTIIEQKPGVGEQPIMREAGLATGVPDEKPLVLVVDDDAGVVSYLTQFFQEKGFIAKSASNGREALEMAREHHPDLITMDMVMPVLDGRSTIQHLRSDVSLCQIPIIALTAMPGKVDMGSDLSFNKPVDEEALLNGARMLISGHALGTNAKGRVSSCLLLNDPNLPVINVPEINGMTEMIPCHGDELLNLVRGGFQGLVVIPSELFGRLDEEFLKKISALQILIFPNRVSTHENRP
ncbi:MAG: ATP-binding protein [Magnetococcus sp. DMHC-1]